MSRCDPVALTGQIDEVTLYDRALLASEISTLYTVAGGGKCGSAPSLITQPGDQTANVGNNVLFQVLATGTSLTYQWLFDNRLGGGPQPIPGANSPVLTLMNLLANQAGSYSVRVANAEGLVTSSAAVLTVNSVGNGTPPVIVTQPPSTTGVCDGGAFALTVSATGSAPLRYQWCKNGFNINGATAATFSLSQASPADAGTYTVIVYDAVGQVTSASAVVTLHSRPTAAVSGDTTVPSGLPTVVRVQLTGTQPWNLTWKVDPAVGGASAMSETGVTDNPHLLVVSPTSTTTYTLTSVADANCQAAPGDLTGQATVTVSGASEQPPSNAGAIPLSGTYHGFTFAGDSTYYVNGDGGPVYLDGTTTIEGGTVVLFSSSSDAKIVILGSQIVCDTAPYRPAIFTCANNFDFGYYEGDTSQADQFGQGLSLALPAGSSVVLKDLRFSRLNCGISIDGTGASSYKLYDSQFADCVTAIGLTDPDGCQMKVLNVLFCDDTNVLAVDPAVLAPNVQFQHVTADGCISFVAGLSSVPSATWSGLNSLLVDITNQTTSIPASISQQPTCKIIDTIQGNPPIFMQGGDGFHYLYDDTFRGAGSLSGIDSVLLGELPQKSTHPPLDIPLPLQPDDYFAFETSGSITLSPQVPRCLSGTPPDLGYAYDALDYTLSTVWLNDGGQITVLPGTAIGFRFDWFVGFLLDQGTSFISHGTPNKPITYAPVSLVQEGPFNPQFPFPGFTVSFIPNYWPNPDYNPDGAPPPVLDFRFSNFYLPSGLSHHFWGGMGCLEMLEQSPMLALGFLETSFDSAMSLQMQDCNLHSGWLNLGEPDGNVVVPVDFGGQVIPGSVSLVNNLFDRVNCNLDPDTGPTWWSGPYLDSTVDLSLTATNNLFRGGWLFLEPVSAQSPEWAFVNNFFDTVTVAQDTVQPFYYDYNAYYPPGTTYKLNGSGGAHELSPLAQPLVYQAGPLGNFYQDQASSPLLGLGCATADQLGFYHYTTQVPTAAIPSRKEADSTVDIGLLYIATDANGVPLDSDNDRIPDYVENWHGDGDYASHVDTETDWQNPTTLAGTPDPQNSIYDDIDLSGDGTVGRIKIALGTSPLGSSNPLALTQVISGADPDVVNFEVPISYTLIDQNSANQIGKLDLLMDGKPVAVGWDQDANGMCRLTWEITFSPPGIHVLQAAFVLNRILTAGPNPDPTVITAMGSPITYIAHNGMQFDPFYSQYDESHGAILYATTPTCPNANYVIELQTPNGDHIRTINGSTSNGEISETWDLKDDGGNTITSDSVNAIFNVTLLDPGLYTSTQNLNRVEHEYLPVDGDFTVAYTGDHSADEQDLHNCIQLTVVDQLIGQCNATFCYDHPYSSTFNAWSALGTISGKPGHLATQTDSDALLANLSNENVLLFQDLTKNFYFWGHGRQNNLGTAVGDDSVHFYARDVANALGNSSFTYFGPGHSTPGKHRFGQAYRLVFLDGCATAMDSEWAHAFGVYDQITTKKLATWPEQAQAFVGWDYIKRVPGPGNRFDMSSCYSVFWSAWQNGLPLDRCIWFASQDHPPAPIGFMDLTKYNFGPTYEHWSSYYRWKYGVTTDAHIKLYGYAGITRTGYVPGYDNSNYHK